MANYSYNLSKSSDYDDGLRAYMISVMNNMAGGVALSGIVAYLISTSPALVQALFGTWLVWVVMLAPIPMVFVVAWAASSWALPLARLAYYAFTAIVGVSLASIFLIYTLGSVFQVFFITASMFAVLALWGYTTKKDLSGWGSFLIMGVWGLVAAGLVSIFFPNPMLAFITNVAGVIIFSGLTAYDMQKIKNIYRDADDENNARLGIMGAMALYLDFINLMLYLLKLFGQRRD